jgi:toxin-antitoxin system PIN domain toxin
MDSCDTNILFYALNPRCPEHAAARGYLDAQGSNRDFGLCELVLLELYVLLRNPAVSHHPAEAPAAVARIRQLRSNPNWALLDYPGGLMDEVWTLAAKPGTRYGRIFDLRLAVTLRHHGVTRFATRNVKDFAHLGLAEVFDPLR